MLLAHLRDEVERAGRSQTEIEVKANGVDSADDILLLEDQARNDKELGAILHDLAEMVRAFRRKLAAANLEPVAELMVAEDQAPYAAGSAATPPTKPTTPPTL